MHIVVMTCKAYEDALDGFWALFKRFWPACPYPVHTVCDDSGNPNNWCRIVMQACDDHQDEPILLLLEDYWFTQPAQPELIAEAIAILENDSNVGMVRLTPWPGAGGGVDNFGVVERGEPFRISLQAAIWRPLYLKAVAKLATGGSAWDFELEGGEAANGLPDSVMAWRSGRWPWPIQYDNTIRNGKWASPAKELAHKYQLKIDWSKRPFIEA